MRSLYWCSLSLMMTVPAAGADKPDPLAELRKKVAEIIPAISVGADRPAEVRALAAAMTELDRAQFIERFVTPGEPPKLNLADLGVDDWGTSSEAVKVVRVDSGTAVFSVPRGRFDTALFAVTGINTEKMATDQVYRLSGTYKATRTGKFGSYTLVVLEPYTPPRGEEARARLALAQKAVGEADRAEQAARKAFSRAREAAEAAEVQRVKNEAKKLLDNTEAKTIQERIRVQRDYDDFLAKSLREAKDRITKLYEEPQRPKKRK